MRKGTVLVAAISIVLIASGVAGLAYHLADIRSASTIDYGFVMLVRALAIVAGTFMLLGRNWARWLAMAWISFHVIVSAFHPLAELVIHLVVFAVFAFVLFRSDAAGFFRRPAA